MKGVKQLEKKLLAMSSHSYDAIDREMKRIAKAEGITPKQLQENFQSAHNGQIPDDWIKKQMDDQNFMCADGKCENCPKCDKKKEMMAIGYSEAAVDAVIDDLMHQYGEKRDQIFDKGKYGKGLSEKQQDSAQRSSDKAMKAEKDGKGLKEQFKPWSSDKAYQKKLKDSGKKMPESEATKAYKRQFGDSSDNAEMDEQEFNEALRKKAAKSGISYGILKKVYERGMAAWKSGHRPGVPPQQWAMGRVNSFITGKGGARKADADLLGGGKSKGGKGKRQGKNRKS